MTDFKVQPAALDKLADLLDRAKEDADAGRKHLADFRDLEHGEGILNERVHETTLDAINGWLATLGTEAIASAATAVRNAAKYYRAIEEANARAFDEQQFPATYVTEIREHTDYVEIEPPEGVGRFQDVTEPQEYLRKVDPDGHDVANMVHIAWWEAFSITAMLNEAFVKATEFLSWIGMLDRPYNPLEDLFKPFVGDWAGVYATAEALENLAHTLRNVSTNIHWASQGCEEVWQGNAGDGAAIHLMRVGDPINEIVVPLLELSKEYKTFADGMVEYRDGLVGLYKGVSDTVIELSIAAGVAGGSTASGIGAPVGVLAGLYAGYKASRVAQAVHQIIDLINDFMALKDAWEGATYDFTRIEGGIKLPALQTSGLRAPE